MISNNIFFYAEGRYILAKKEVPHLIFSEFDEEEVLEINLGGASFSLGIKFLF